MTNLFAAAHRPLVPVRCGAASADFIVRGPYVLCYVARPLSAFFSSLPSPRTPEIETLSDFFELNGHSAARCASAQQGHRTAIGCRCFVGSHATACRRLGGATPTVSQQNCQHSLYGLTLAMHSSHPRLQADTRGPAWKKHRRAIFHPALEGARH